MVNISMDKIVEKLSPLLKLSLEESAQYAISEGNYNVEIEHWFHSLLEKPHTDIGNLLRLNAEFDADVFKKGKRVMTPGGKHKKELKKVYKNKKDANDYMAAIMIAKGGG